MAAKIAVASPEATDLSDAALPSARVDFLMRLPATLVLRFAGTATYRNEPVGDVRQAALDVVRNLSPELPASLRQSLEVERRDHAEADDIIIHDAMASGSCIMRCRVNGKTLDFDGVLVCRWPLGGHTLTPGPERPASLSDVGGSIWLSGCHMLRKRAVQSWPAYIDKRGDFDYVLDWLESRRREGTPIQEVDSRLADLRKQFQVGW